MGPVIRRSLQAGQNVRAGVAGRGAETLVGHPVGERVVAEIPVDLPQDFGLLERVIAAQDARDQLFGVVHGH